MSDLVAWLLVQIAEDERIAREAALHVGWRGFGDERVDSGKDWVAKYHVVLRKRSVDGPVERGVADCGPLTLSAARHIATFDPARVMAECEAKRRIVEDHGWEYADPYETWKGDEYREKWGGTRDQRHCTRCGGTQPHRNLGLVPLPVSWPCPTLRLLAEPYADRPGYDESWRP